MQIVSVFGGLGSQMLKYAFFLKLKENYGNDCYIDIQLTKILNSWNGYELERVFGIKENEVAIEADNIHSYNEYVIHILDYLYATVQSEGVFWINYGKKYSWPSDKNVLLRRSSRGLLSKIIWFIKYYSFSIRKNEMYYTDDYLNLSGSAWWGEFNHTSGRYLADRNVLKKVFAFPEFTNGKDIEISSRMAAEESVAVSVRRSDHMYDNGILFLNGYYKKAVNLVRNNSRQPHFYIFSEDMDWCKKNKKKLGLNDGDVVDFIDWNRNQESYRDMQLQTFCQHNILAKSSFGWWGYYLSKRNNKIVCAPKKCWDDVDNCL